MESARTVRFTFHQRHGLTKLAQVVAVFLSLAVYVHVPAVEAQHSGLSLQPVLPLSPAAIDDSHLYKQAAEHYRNENWPVAVDGFEKLISQFPESALAVEGRFYLGEALIQVKRHSDAADVFQQVIELQKDDDVIRQARFRLAECQFAVGELEKARAGFEAFVDEYRGDPLNEYALPWLAELENLTGHYELAERHYKELISQSLDLPQINKYRLGLARSLGQLGRAKEADRYLLHVGSEKESELADDAILLSAKMWMEEGDYQTADERITRLLQEQPESTLLDEADYLLAKARIARGDWSGAWTAIEKRADHVWPPALAAAAATDIALIAVRTGNLDVARQKLDELAGLAGFTESLLSIEIELAIRQGDQVLTEELLSRLELSFPNSPYIESCCEMVARNAYQSGDCESAAAHYRRLLDLLGKTELRPDKMEQHGNRVASVRYRYALALIDCRRYEEALDQLPRFSVDQWDADLEGPVSLARAVCLLETGNYQDAIPHFQKYLELKPEGAEHVRCRADLARSLAKAGRLDEAEGTIQAVLTGHEGDSAVMRACETIAEISMERNDRETAHEFYQTLARSPDPAIAARGNEGLAMTAPPEIPEQNPLKPLIEAPRADDTLANMFAEANRCYSELEFPHAISLYEEILRQGPDSPNAMAARLRMAICLLRNGNPADRPRARELLNTVVESGDEESTVELGLYELGWAEQQDGELTSARDRFRILVERFPESHLWSDALYREAALARKLGELDQATALFTRLCSEKPDDALVPFARQAMGEICADRGEWDRATGLFEKVQQTAAGTPLMIPALYWAAECRYQKGLLNVAERQFEMLSRMDLEDRQMAASVALRLAQCHMRREDWNAVRESLQAAESRIPGLTTGYQFDFIRARMAMSESKFAEARNSFQRVLVAEEAKGTETAAMAQWMIGETFLHERLFDVALHAYQTVEQEHSWPEWNALAVLQMAKCQAGLGQHELAEASIRRLMSQWPDSTAAVDARQLLSQLRRETARMVERPAVSDQLLQR